MLAYNLGLCGSGGQKGFHLLKHFSAPLWKMTRLF